MKYCTFCKLLHNGLRVDAVWRDSRLNFACEEHKLNLYEDFNRDFTDADYQTWLKL